MLLQLKQFVAGNIKAYRKLSILANITFTTHPIAYTIKKIKIRIKHA